MIRCLRNCCGLLRVVCDHQVLLGVQPGALSRVLSSGAASF